MKQRKIIHTVVLALVALIVCSCSVVQIASKTTREGTIRELEVPIPPITADLKIDQVRKTASAVDKSSIRLDFIKNNAVRNILEQNDADIIISPSYTVENDGTNIKVTVSGYVAVYTNVTLALADGSYVETTGEKETEKPVTKIETAASPKEPAEKPARHETKTVVAETKATIATNNVVQVEMPAKAEPKITEPKPQTVVEPIAVPAQAVTQVVKKETQTIAEVTVAEVPQKAISENIVTKEEPRTEQTKAVVSETRQKPIMESYIPKEEPKTVDSKPAQTRSTAIQPTVSATASESKVVEASKPATAKVTVEERENKYQGEMKRGVPHGSGVMTFNLKTKIPGSEVSAEKGDYIAGKWKNGALEYGTLYNSDGREKAKIVVGR